jgi:hypothetical protein
MARSIASSILVCCVFAALAMPASAGDRLNEPRRFHPATDGDLVQVTNPVDGQTWSVWTYRNGPETDIALQSLDKASGRSGQLIFIGQDDRVDQVRPALTFDSNGSLYLSFVERESGIVKLSALAFGAAEWTEPQAITGGGDDRITPGLSVVEARLVVGYVSDGAVAIRHFHLIAPAVRGSHKMSDGPDPTYSDQPPFPEEDDKDRDDPRNTLETPDIILDIDASID